MKPVEVSGALGRPGESRNLLANNSSREGPPISAVFQGFRLCN